jgi:hypothetical protein
MTDVNYEIARVKLRIAKCDRRIKRGYVAPPGKETEEHRKERLEKRLAELEAGSGTSN